jgi:hypothetical protein
MDILLLTLGILTAVAVYYNKKLGVVVGLIAMLILIEYPVKIKDSVIGDGDSESCKKECTRDDENKLVCKTECVKNLRSILK